MDMTDPSRTTSAEDKFRSSLQDVSVLLQRLGPLCQTLDDLHEMVQLALEKDHQLRLLMQVVLAKR